MSYMFNRMFRQKACTVSYINSGSYIQLSLARKTLESTLGRGFTIASSFEVLLNFHEVVYLAGLLCPKEINMNCLNGTVMRIAFEVN